MGKWTLVVVRKGPGLLSCTQRKRYYTVQLGSCFKFRVSVTLWKFSILRNQILASIYIITSQFGTPYLVSYYAYSYLLSPHRKRAGKTYIFNGSFMIKIIHLHNLVCSHCAREGVDILWLSMQVLNYSYPAWGGVDILWLSLQILNCSHPVWGRMDFLWLLLQILNYSHPAWRSRYL